MEHEILGGELSTDKRGDAVVDLPDRLHGRELELEHRLTCRHESGAGAELADGRLTIWSSAPHSRVAWRLVRRSEVP